MGRRPLFILTRSFPFGHGEEFLETELPCLARTFEPVALFPLSAHGASRPLPPNATVDDGLAQREAGLPRRLLHTGLSPVRTPAFIRELISEAPRTFHPAGFRRLLTETRRAVATRDALRRATARLGQAARAPILYSYWFTGQTAGALLARRSCGGGPVVTRAHRFDLYEELYRPRYIPYRAWSMRGIARVFPVSDDGSARLGSLYPAQRGKIVTARLGVPDPGALSRPSNDGTFRLLSCGNCIPLKRLDLLARGVAGFAKARRGRILWTHVGDGPTRPEIEAIAHAEFSAQTVLRVTGRLPHGEVLELYRREPIDLFASVSESEGVPVSVMEALSFGVPVVATAVGGIREIVGGMAGRLLDPMPSAETVAGALREAAETGPGEHDARRAAARTRWKERFNADVNYPDFARALEGLCGSVESGARP